MRFGLVGAGSIGGVRARALEASPHCDLVAVVDPDTVRAQRVARRTGALVFDDLRRLLDAGTVDAVVLSTPPSFHEPMALEALDAGLHVLCEKPLAPSVGACRRMVERARSAGRTLACGFNHRYFPAFRRVREAVESGEIGDLAHVRAFAGHVGLPELHLAWQTDPGVMGGGALMDNGIHLLDLTRSILGEVAVVSGYASEQVWQRRGCEDNAFALLRSPTGQIATLHASWTEWRGYRLWLAAYGTRGAAWAYYAPMLGMVVRLDELGGRARRRFHCYPQVNLMEKLRSWKWTVLRTFIEEFRDFRGLVEGRRGTLAEGFDGFRAVEMAQAVYRSSADERAVRLCDPF